MAEQTQEEGGIGVSGVVGGIAGGAAAGHYAQRYAANRGIRAVIAGTETTEKFTKLVNDTLAGEKGAALVQGQEFLDSTRRSLATIDPTKITKIVFEEDAVAKATGKTVHNMIVHLEEGVTKTIEGIEKLPSGAKVGEPLAADAAKKLFEGDKSFVKTTIAKMEGQLANGIRKASGYFSGFSNVGWKGKTAIIGATVAGVAAGGYALNAMFGPGKHTARVEQEAAPAAGASR
jgi:hypothetical protein